MNFSITDAIDQLGSSTEPDTSQRKVFSSGPTPITVTDEWRQVTFGFKAHMVAVRSDQPILVAFEKPFTNPSAQILLTTEELPFSMGGDNPLYTPEMWVKSDESAEQDAEVQITAREV